MGEPGFQFGCLPYRVYAAGGLGGLSGAAVKVWCGLIAHADRNGGLLAHPGQALLARNLRLDTRTVQRALRELESRGLVECVRAGRSKAAAATYRVETDPQRLKGVPLMQSTPGDTTGGQSDAPPAKPPGVNLPDSRRNGPVTPGDFVPDSRRFRPPNREGEQRGRTPSGVAGQAPDEASTARPVGDLEPSAPTSPGHAPADAATDLLGEPVPTKPKGKGKPKASTPREPDRVWDALAALFYPRGVPQSEHSRLGKAVRDMKSLEVSTSDYERLHNAMRTQWQGKPFGVEAFVKWSGAFADNAGKPRNNGDLARIRTSDPSKYAVTPWNKRQEVSS